MRLTVVEADVAQIDRQVPDAQPVVAVQVLRAGDHVAPLADASAEMHVEDGREDRCCDQRQRDDRPSRDHKRLEDATESS